MEQANVKVSFYLKKSEADADGMCPVMARLNIGKYSEAAFSLKLRVPQAIWSSGRASGKSVKAKEINNRLDEIRAMALGIYAELSVVRDSVTADDVKSLLLGMAGEQTTLLSYFRTFIENFAKRVGVNRTEGSLRSYRNAYNHVERFMREKYNLSDIPFSALTLSFIQDYDSHLRTDCRLSPGTIINLTVQLKIIVGEAVADGIITTYPFTGYEPVRPKQKRRYLTSEELQRLMTMPLHRPNLYLTRDLFLFSCYTGIPYSDMRLLSKEHLSLADDGTWWIRSSRRKTGVEFEIPLLDLPLHIMEKYTTLVYILHPPIIPNGKLDMAGNLRSGTESQPPIEAIKHLVTEHIAYHLFCRGSSLIGSDGFFCFTKQADVKIWSSVDEQTDVPSYGKLVTDMDGNIQVVRGTLIV